MAIQSKIVEVKGQETNVLRTGDSANPSILLIHGSGPGASAITNWAHFMETFGDRYALVAPDLWGFGGSPFLQSPLPTGTTTWLGLWTEQVRAVLDQCDLTHTHLIGNSLGGGLALHLLQVFPERFDRVVLMGPVGTRFTVPPALAQAWGFYAQPSEAALQDLIRGFVFAPESVGGDLSSIVRSRWAAVMDPQLSAAYAAIFGGDAQNQADALAIADADLAEITHETLIVHAREDRYVPYTNGVHLQEVMPRSQLHIFGQCGHWVQVEKRDAFEELVENFLQGRLD